MRIFYPLMLPVFNYRIKNKLGKAYILDVVRKKYLLLTPEEWVRQHILHYLISYCYYPRGLFRLEKKIDGIAYQYRPDIVLYDKRGMAKMIIECKAPYISLDSSLHSKILQYHRQLASDFLLLTNGITHFCWHLEKATCQCKAMTYIPMYQELMYP